MKLTFLGTGASKGLPIIGSTHKVCLSTDAKDIRLRSSALLEWNESSIVVDCGPDFRAQMLARKVTKLDAIIYTHEHSDHTAGLDDIRPFTQRNGDLPIYAKKRVLKDLKKRFSYIFETENKYPSAPSVIGNRIKNNSFFINDLEVLPIKVKHGKLSIFGYRFNRIAYLTDVSFISVKEKNKLKKLAVLVINVLQIKEHPTHFNLDQALGLIADLKPEKAFITHIGPRLGLHQEVVKLLPENVFLAYDGLSVEV